ncbi:MAG TPA: class I SAM-dependent RNA methyltransferase [Pyrinomonadaceae bacterium]|nr:class I SAM-dependent RNA methyltransferase [Pyrinomonadaceae bacterium]
MSSLVGECFAVEIERILPGGLGLAHAAGKTLFVSLAAPGDKVRVQVEREQGNVLFASIVEILTPSSVRVEPPCPYFGRCGGCDFQQLTYEAQLAAKAEIIGDCLQRIARLDHVPQIEVQPSPYDWRYRVRATWQIDREQQTIGYYERGSRRVCDVVECAVLMPELQRTLERVRATSWDEFPAELKHLDVVAGENGVSVSPEFAEFRTNELSLRVGNEVYRYNAESFFQINPALVGKMIEFALGDAGGAAALDLYCGVALFTLPLARRFEKVVGVEANPNAVRFAKRNLQDAGLENARVVNAGVADWIRRGSQAVEFVLLDPPRAGAESVVIRGILNLGPERISYVSCDPATLARDLKKLLAGGYAIEALRGFDLFPQTHHVETVVLLRRLS